MTTLPNRKLILVAMAVIGALILELVLQFFFRILVVYTHLFYVVLVMAAIWFQKKALVLAFLLGIVHVGIEYYVLHFIPPEAVARAAAFILVTLVAAIAAERLVTENEGNLRTTLFRQSVAIREGRAVDVRGGVIGTHPADYFPGGRRTGDLISALGNRDPDVRNQAAEALGEQRDPLAVPALAPALHDDDPGVRWKAAEALGRIGKMATSVLSEALRDADPDVRWKAAVALGESGSDTAIEPLVHALNDPDPFVRSRVARALSRYRDAALQPALAAMVAADPLMRAGAAVALGEIGGENAVHALIHAFSDPDSSVRQAAGSAVVLQGEKAIVPLIGALGTPEARDAAATALAHLGEPAVQPLVRALTGTDPAIRAGAEHALGLMKEPSALRALIEYRDRKRCIENEQPGDTR